MENNKNEQITTVEDNDIMQIFDRADISMDKLNESLNVAGDIVTTVKETAQIFVTIREIDKDIINIDAELQRFMKTADDNLDKFKIKAVIVENQLDKFSNKLDTILNKAMAINTSTENEQEIKFRTDLLTQLNKWGDTMSSLLMKLLAA